MVYELKIGGQYIPIPMESMVESLAHHIDQSDSDIFIRPFNEISLNDQLKLIFPLRDKESLKYKNVIKDLSDKVIPGNIGKFSETTTSEHNCGLTSGTSSDIWNTYFLIGERGIYFNLKTGHDIIAKLVDSEHDGLFTECKPTKEPTNIYLHMFIATEDGVYVKEHTHRSLMGFTSSTFEDGDVSLNFGCNSTLYFDDRPQDRRQVYSSPHITLNVPKKSLDKKVLRMLKEGASQPTA